MGIYYAKHPDKMSLTRSKITFFTVYSRSPTECIINHSSSPEKLRTGHDSTPCRYTSFPAVIRRPPSINRIVIRRSRYTTGRLRRNQRAWLATSTSGWTTPCSDHISTRLTKAALSGTPGAGGCSVTVSLAGADRSAIRVETALTAPITPGYF